MADPTPTAPLVFSSNQVTFTFNEFEIPETLNALGGEQQYALHQYPGGRRVIQTFGAIPNQISWTGSFLGSNTFERAQSLDALRAAGQPVTMTYGQNWKYVGLISKLEIKPGWEGFIPYSITFIPQEDQSLGLPPAPTQNLDNENSNIQAGLNNTIAGYTGNSLAIVAAAKNTLAVVASINNTIAASGGGSLANVQAGALGSQVQAVNNIIASLSAVVPPQPINATIDVVDGLDNTSNEIDDAIVAQQMTAYLTRMALVLTAPPPQTVTILVNNPDLFLLAAQYFGDASQWQVIADANPVVVAWGPNPDTNISYQPFPAFSFGIYTLVIPQVV